MNNKGQIAGIGAIIVVFVAIIVGLSLFSGGIAPAIGDSTLTETVVNSTVDGTPGTNLTLTGQYATNFQAVNRSSGNVLPATNYTVNNLVILSTGSLGSTVTWKEGTLTGNAINVSYTYEPLGYAHDSGSRTMITMIAIFAALAIAVAAIAPSIKNAIDNFS